MKYQFVKRRQEVSTDKIQSFRNFDSVLTGSKQVTGLVYSGKLLWGLAIVPLAGIIYFVMLTQHRPAEEKVALSSEPPLIEETTTHATTANEKTQEQEAGLGTKADRDNKPDEISPAKSQAATPLKSQQKPQESKADNELKKEDVYLNAEPKEGFEQFYAFIESELTYPELARKDSVQGYVKVIFSIDVDGKLKEVSIVESLGELFDNEAIRVIKRSPPWKPANFNGYPVSSRMSIKLTFNIE